MEIISAFRIHREAGTRLSGIHLELTGEDVTECLGGPANLTEADLQRDYPNFFWNSVHPYIGDALKYLELTQSGRMWVANLYAPVFAAEHELDAG